MKATYYIIPIIALSLLGEGCRRNEAKERVQAQREAWEASLPDTLQAIKQQTDSLRKEILLLTDEAERQLPAFEYVENPREVEGYYIAKAWAPKYPLTKTGLVARLTKGEKLELIAALSGGAHFNRLRIETATGSATTSEVPHDQALNYRMTGLNIVCFSDSASNSCAELIANSAGEKINVIYLDGDKKTGSMTYPETSQTVMAETWKLYSTRSALTHDQRMIPLLAKKGAIITEKIENLKNKKP